MVDGSLSRRITMSSLQKFFFLTFSRLVFIQLHLSATVWFRITSEKDKVFRLSYHHDLIELISRYCPTIWVVDVSSTTKLLHTCITQVMLDKWTTLCTIVVTCGCRSSAFVKLQYEEFLTKYGLPQFSIWIKFLLEKLSSYSHRSNVNSLMNVPFASCFKIATKTFIFRLQLTLCWRHYCACITYHRLVHTSLLD